MNDDEYVKHLKQLLLDTDYSVLEDVNLTEESKAEFVAYRASVRLSLINFVPEARNYIPTLPEAIWAE
jgi:hypothetical protein|tara:strand:+ start:977 stop:1180 length:204 start_codon:yes stop_codon:yes gene_type:complete